MEENSTYILPIIGEIGKDFKFTDLMMHLNAAKDSQIIQGVIASDGGGVEEGLKMRNALLNCGKIIKMRNSGNVASIAVSIFTTAQKQFRTFDPSKGVFLIHLPIVQPQDLKEPAYNADELEYMAKALKGYGNELAKDYSKDTGSDIEVLKAFMAENTPLTPEQITALGFATIEQPQFKAVALIHNNKSKMEKKEVIDRLDKHESLLDKIHRKLFAKNLMLQDVNGVEIDFGDAVETPEQIVVGVEAKIDGKPAEGEVVMADGTKLVFTGGVLTEIMPAESEDVEALKAKIAELEAKNNVAIEAQNKLQKDLEDFKASSEAELTLARNEFKAFKAQYSKTPPAGNTPPSGGEETNRVKKFLKKE